MHEKRFDIQGLRAWAVISVVIFHFFPEFLPLGFLGVDVFFVLSGYLISLVLDGKPSTLRTFENFYTKRLRRIFPLAILVTFLNLILMYCLLVETEVVNGVKSAKYSLFFAMNVKPSDAQEDYFQALESANDLFTHYWSLSVEIQFYLIAPFLKLLLATYTADKTTGMVSWNFSILSIIASLSFLYRSSLQPQDAFGSTPSRIWQFIFGAYAFNLEQYLHKPADCEESLIANSEKSSLPATNGMSFFAPLILGAIFFTTVFAQGFDQETLLRVATTLLAAVILVCKLKWPILCHSLMQLIGDASYALYLIHWPVVCILNQYEVDSLRFKFLAMVSCFALSIVCHLYYEKWYLTLPMRDTYLIVVALYSACIATILLCPYEVNADGSSSATSNATDGLWYLDSNRDISEQEAAIINAKFERDNSRRMSFPNCTARPGTGNNPFCFCDITKSNGSLHFMVIGNSYAANIGPLVVKSFKSNYGKMQTRSIPQCEPFFMRRDAYCRDPETARSEFNKAVEQERPDVLFIITRYLEIQAPILGSIQDDLIYKTIMERMSFFEGYVKKKVFILQAFPLPARLPDLEKRRRAKGLPMLPYMIDGVERDGEPMRKRIVEVAKNCKKCAIFDVKGLFLNEAGNFTVLHPKTHLRYFDRARHLTPVGLKLIEPLFAKMSTEMTTLLGSKYPENVVEWKN